MNRQSEHRVEHEELLALYALHALEGEDLQAIEDHLATGCAWCAAELEQRLGEVMALAEGAGAVAPSPAVRRAVLDAVAGTAAGGPADPRSASSDLAPPVSPTATPPRTVEPVRLDERRRARPDFRPPARSRAGWLLALAAVLAAVLAWSLYDQSALRDRVRDAESANGQLAARLERNERELGETRQRLALASAALAGVASGPTTQLAGLAPAPGARGRMFLAEDGRAVFVADRLPPLAAGRTYQLWGIVDGQPVSAGLLTPQADGRAFLVTDRPATGPVDVWAVTEEPAGGVPQPTGAMVLKS